MTSRSWPISCATRGSALVLALALTAASAVSQEEPTHESVRRPLPGPEVLAKLPPDGGPEFNRLVFEASPYLLQHARNPVDWYPWGEEAFARAEREDKPIFLSVGYSTCHWCHVMERESFEDPGVAKLLNEFFVCIKVDREERPDVDQVYMTVTQGVTGSGGWPMTVMMTSAREPFFAATYIPRETAFGRRGLLELLPAVGKAWRTERENLVKSARGIVDQLSRFAGGTSGPDLSREVLDRAADAFTRSFDAEHGGFGDAPKFPRPHVLRFLLRRGLRTGDREDTAMVVRTLKAMRRGGIWDHVGLGFHRYSTDGEWLVPHFEKMLYDQALIAIACVEAWQATGDDELRRTAEEILTYVERDLTAPGGGFWSAEDADSEGEEGRFYLWTTDELVAALGEEDAAFAARVWNARPEGNFTSPAAHVKPRANVLHLRGDTAALAAKTGLEPTELGARLERVRRALFAAREARVHPLKDDKVLTDWNGLMIAAAAMAGSAFDEPRWRRMAERAADFLLAEHRTEEGRLVKRSRQGEAGLPGLLDDHAFVVWGLVELYEADFDERYLAEAVRLTELALERFWDAEHAGFFLAPDDGEELIVRSKELYDGAIPSGNSVFAHELVRLARITGREDFEERAAELFRAFAGDVRRDPTAYPQLLLALDFALGPSNEVVVAGRRDAPDTLAMQRALAQSFLPFAVILLRPMGESEPTIVELAPYTESQTAVDGRATAYVCRDHACRRPTSEIGEMFAGLDASGNGEAAEGSPPVQR